MTLQTYQGKTMTDFDMKSYHFYIKEVNHLYLRLEAHSEEEARKEFELHRKDADQMRDNLEDHCYLSNNGLQDCLAFDLHLCGGVQTPCEPPLHCVPQA